MSDDLSLRHCRPCEGGVPPLRPEQSEALLEALHDDWFIEDGGRGILRTFEFPDYSRTLGFANAVAWVAIAEDHHPLLTVGYNRCVVSYTTHAIGGLSDNDFICAAKVDRLVASS